MSSTDMRDARAGAVDFVSKWERVIKALPLNSVPKPKGTLKTMLWEATARINELEGQLSAANAAIRERDERLARIRNLADIGGFYPGHCMASALKQALRDILALTEKRAEAEHE